MTGPAIRLSLTVPVDRAWLEARAVKRGIPAAQILAQLGDEITGKLLDDCRWHDGLDALSIVHETTVEGAA